MPTKSIPWGKQSQTASRYDAGIQSIAFPLEDWRLPLRVRQTEDSKMSG
ncbi:hypothetical protein [Leptolyngbya ohadii]|nr:hypothetical protein [Leptolyngbya ohadii]